MAGAGRPAIVAAMNAAWHEAHPMPPHATFDERVAWHRDHAAACGCRKPPPDIAAVLAEEAGRPSTDTPSPPR
jgi:hypothetical protein